MYVLNQTQNQNSWQTEKDDVIESTNQVKTDGYNLSIREKQLM